MPDAAIQHAHTDADFAGRLGAVAGEVGALLERLLSTQPEEGELARPPRLLAAIRHATLGGGKRLRPFLTVETAALFGAPRERALMVGTAIECVHCYSLVHDDLPAMDDDSLRRGQPTVHVAFDEATAILAGDSLLTFAFDLMARPESHPDPAVRIGLVSGLARAAGLGGMVGGQILDLAAEGRFGAGQGPSDERATLQMQAMKTGALIQFACEAGAMVAGADMASREAVARYGRALGQAFQIADDLLDLEGDSAALGKATGKDDARGKATLAALLGRERAHARLEALIDEAESALAPFGAKDSETKASETKASTLMAAARFVAQRKS